ncbi:MAG: carboxypeptidase-like regulatory domain-containing protein [Salinivirgaceae bacterium]
MRFLFLLFFSLPLWLYSQELFEIKGVVSSNADSLPMVYAHIGIPSHGIGTVSNIYGEFRLQIECEKSDSLQISYLGYKTIKRPVVELLKDTVFYLEEFDVAMEQINIIPQETLKDLVKKAIKAMPRNYASKLHYAKGFYRETQYSKSTNEFTRLLEVAFNMQDRGINSDRNNIRLMIDQIRKSDNHSEVTLFSKVLSKMFPEGSNGLYMTLTFNPIRRYHYQKNSASDNVLKSLLKDTATTLVLERIVETDNAKFYEIGFTTYTKWNKVFGTLIINESDYAIVKIETLYNSIFKEDLEIFNFTAEYKKFDSRYYPIYILHKRVADQRLDNNGVSTIGFSINKIIFTDYYFKKSDFNRIKQKFDLTKEGDIYNYDGVYNPDFWENYNMLIKEPIQSKVIDDLSKTRKLSKQFEEQRK